MTFPPERIGDQGQRFEVRYTDEVGAEKQFGWSDDMSGVEAMLRSIALHPSMTNGRYVDRKLSPAAARKFTEVFAVYKGSNGEATKALYKNLEQFGAAGTVAVNVFRACKASERAKLYRGRGYKGEAYAKKEWSIGNLADALGKHADELNIRWGWKQDPKQELHNWVIYVDLPAFGQVSFHTASRGTGPDFPFDWDGAKGMAPTRICQWIASLYEKVGLPA